MAQLAHMKGARVHWIAPPGTDPTKFVPGFLVQIPDGVTEGQEDQGGGVFADPPPPPPAALDDVTADLIDAITATGKDKADAIARLTTLKADKGRRS